MHCLSIVFNAGSPVMWKLLFREKENAESALNHLLLVFNQQDVSSADRIGLVDDFGQTVNIKAASLDGCMLEDLDQSKLAHIEMSLHEAKTRAKAQKQAQTDPELRTSQMMQGMPVLSPMGNGRMG